MTPVQQHWTESPDRRWWPAFRYLSILYRFLSLNYYKNMSRNTLKKLKRIGLLGLVIWVTTAAIGCNTMHGLGTDVEKAGEKLQKESD